MSALAPLRATDEVRFPGLKEIKTHPALDCIPMMNKDEFARLVWSIRKIGLIHPISQDESGLILDGRCRLLACEIAQVEPRLDLPKDKAAAYIFAANSARRHLNRDQRAMVAAVFLDMVENGFQDDGFVDYILAENITRRHLNPGQLRIADALIDEPDFPETLVVPEAKLVARHPDLVKRVVAGTLQISEAYNHVIERERSEAERAIRMEAFARLRAEAPLLAIEVDEGKLTVEQALTQADEDAEALAEHAQAIRALGQRMTGDAIEIGRRLLDAKKRAGHGKWLPWLNREFGWSDDTALNFMRLAQLAESRNVRDLNLPLSGLYLLARPSTPDAVRDIVLGRAGAGEALSFAEIKREMGGEKQAVDGRLRGLAKIAQQLADERPNDLLVHELQSLITVIESRARKECDEGEP